MPIQLRDGTVLTWPMVLADRLAKPLGLLGPGGSMPSSRGAWYPRESDDFDVRLDAAMASGNHAAGWIAAALQHHDPSDCSPWANGVWAMEAFLWLDYHDRHGVQEVTVLALPSPSLGPGPHSVVSRSMSTFVTLDGAKILRPLGRLAEDLGESAPLHAPLHTLYALEAWFVGTDYDDR